MKTLFHVTAYKNLESIFEKGLISSKGINSKKIEDDRGGVFLCTLEDIPYWSIILGYSSDCVAIGVNLPDDTEMELRQYSYYDEYIYNGDISPERIAAVKSVQQTSEAMTDLCKCYLISISDIVYECMYYYNYAEQSEEDYLTIRGALKALNAVLPHLKYYECDRDELKSFFSEYSDRGTPAFADYVDGKSVLEQLVVYEADDLYEDRKKVYDFVKQNLGFLMESTITA